MSTRALRKLQREQEQERRLADLNAEGDDEDTESSQAETKTSTVNSKVRKKKKKAMLNAFDILGGGDQGEEDTAESASDVEGVRRDRFDAPGTSTPPSTKPKRKRKKTKQKDKGKEHEIPVSSKPRDEKHGTNEVEVDEIDRALRELKVRNEPPTRQRGNGTDFDTQDFDESWEREVSKLLAINSKNLNPTIEMKSLFGSIALERTTRNQGGPDEEGRIDLETALSGRHSPASHGKELGNAAKRRNIFMQGQENWPFATSGGLGMEIMKESADTESRPAVTSSFGKQYEIVHNSSYQDTQRQFRRAVESLIAGTMVHLLIFNPYHIASLLQVAEIAKHQGDHSVMGDLLERALFTFGRSVHSTFGVSVREGRARLSFDEPANRELYLAIWRYIQNLEMRGTWRTAFEWTKMLLSFNILSDPYGVTHALDQYALRGRQHDALIALCSEEAFGNTWAHLPNMQISVALAYHRANQPKLARQKLALAMHRYPYILSHLCSALDITPLPKYLWGKTPTTDAEKLYTELYVTRAKDLWATPETTALLVEVSQTIDSYSSIWKSSPPAPKLEISLEDARHILLLDIPILIALIPRNFRGLPTAQYDVLPPPSSATDAGLTARAPATADGPGQRGPMGFLAELLRVASRGFIGGTDVATHSNTHGANQGPSHEGGAQENAMQDLFSTRLADTVNREDQAAILAAFAEDFGASSDEEAETEAETETETEARARDEAVRIRGQVPPHLTHQAGILASLGNVRLEERPPPTSNNVLHEPPPVQNPVAATPPPISDRSQREDADADADASTSPPPDQYRPRLGSNPLPDLPPPAPTVEDEAEAEPAAARQSAWTTSPPAQQQQTTATTVTADPQHIQRHLLTTGLTTLLQSLPSSSTPSPPSDPLPNSAALEDYISLLRLLRHRDREWVLGIVKQRVIAERGAAEGVGVVEGIRRALG